MFFSSQQKGATTAIISFIIMGIMLIIALSLSHFSVGQIKMGREIGKGLKAYYGAETAIEKCLHERRKAGGTECRTENVPIVDEKINYGTGKEVTTKVKITNIDENCPKPKCVTIQAKGTYGDNSRAIELTLEEQP